MTSPPIIYLDYTYDFLGMENFFTAIKGKRRKAEHKNILVFVGAFKKAKIRLIENKSATVRGNRSAAGAYIVARIAFPNAIIYTRLIEKCS